MVINHPKEANHTLFQTRPILRWATKKPDHPKTLSFPSPSDLPFSWESNPFEIPDPDFIQIKTVCAKNYYPFASSINPVFQKGIPKADPIKTHTQLNWFAVQIPERTFRFFSYLLPQLRQLEFAAGLGRVSARCNRSTHLANQEAEILPKERESGKFIANLFFRAEKRIAIDFSPFSLEMSRGSTTRSGAKKWERKILPFLLVLHRLQLLLKEKS